MSPRWNFSDDKIDRSEPANPHRLLALSKDIKALPVFCIRNKYADRPEQVNVWVYLIK